jgi:tetratricopeptide (TPR) repeat protein
MRKFLKAVLTLAVICIPLLGISEFAYADVQRDINAASAAHKQKDYARAIEIYTNIINSGSSITLQDATAIYANRGLAYHRKGDYVLAIKDYDEAIDLLFERGVRLDGYFWSLRGGAYYLKGDLDHAIQDYKTAVKYSPDIEYYRDSLKKLEAMKSSKKFGGAWQELLKSSPN